MMREPDATQDFWSLNAHVESLAATGNTFWGFYSAVVLGVLTVVVSVPRRDISMPETIFLAGALVIFFIRSLRLIYSNNKLLDAAIRERDKLAADCNVSRDMLRARKPRQTKLTMAAHLLLDVVVIATLFLLE